MNHILQLKGRFQSQKNPSTPGSPQLPIGQSVTASHLDELKNQLSAILAYWKKDTLIQGALVTAFYHHVVAKSNRIKGLLHKGSVTPDDAICGSKFFGDDPIQHVFTYFVGLEALQESIERLRVCSEFVRNEYAGIITQKDMSAIAGKTVPYQEPNLARTTFLQVVVDAYYVEKFTIERDTELDGNTSIVTLYKTGIKTAELLRNVGVDMADAKTIDETTVRLDPHELKLLQEKTPYLIAMRTYDLSAVSAENFTSAPVVPLQIPAPANEPVIGVLDTLFDEHVYFKDWVRYERLVDQNIETTSADYEHGTAVTSLIVDGPAINPNLDDGCGRFRVKHFGIATQGRFSSFSIVKAIREIVVRNREIKVWNLSLGSALPINRNFISPEAAELDKIQCENDVIFVISGTNKPDPDIKEMAIGAPADSLNSIVVNAVNDKGEPASYHRVGPVLSFFNKPDLSYYGGDVDHPMRVCTSLGEKFVSGTSFSAPWISRKMAYLIHKIGFTREVAKALLIDAAASWNRRDDATHAIGYGVVPQRIEDIVQTPDDEIRFIMTGVVQAYETYTYNIPVPVDKEKHPFFARATLCYFPQCSRNQGVDYTSTEMDIHFGRLKKNTNGNAVIKSINMNGQGDGGLIGGRKLREENVRKLYRKWDNVKLINDIIKDRSKPRKVYEQGLWGLSIKTKERLASRNGMGLPFGVVVTLKEMNGKNRVNDFIKACMMRGWIVEEVNANLRAEVYNRAQEELQLE